MKNNLLLWKTLVAEQDNFQNLLTPKCFYWSQDQKLSSLGPNDLIFIVDRKSATFIFAEFDGSDNLLVEVDEINNLSKVIDQSENTRVVAKGGSWDKFVRFKIIQKLEITSEKWIDEFKYTSTNGTIYLFKYQPNKKTQENKFQPSKTVTEGSVLAKLLKLDLHDEAKSALLASLDYAKSFNSGSSELPMKEERELSESNLVDHVHRFIIAKGFRFEREEIANFYLALRTKPFVILAGISGTGKTQLPRKLAEALGFDLEEQLLQISVSPDWTDGSELLGYTSLNNHFVPKALTIAIQRAIKNPSKPYFFILDEMNLARVEHYFSDYLSIVETRKRLNGNKITTDNILRKDQIIGADNGSEFENLKLPENLYMIGTVNMDETTHAFSRKVLDRANSIEMNNVDLAWLTPTKAINPNPTYNTNALFLTPYIFSAELTTNDKASIKDKIDILIELNCILKNADMHFAYRVRDEIAFYLIQNQKYGLMDANKAFDFQVVQKILPRIHGSSERVQKILLEMLFLLEKGKKDEIRIEIEVSELEKQFQSGSFKYPRSSSKIMFMLKRYEEDRFTSFWL